MPGIVLSVEDRKINKVAKFCFSSLPSNEFRQTITKWVNNQVCIICDKCNDKNNRVNIRVCNLGSVRESFSENVTSEGRLECQESSSQIKLQGKNFLEEKTASAKAQTSANLSYISQRGVRPELLGHSEQGWEGMRWGWLCWQGSHHTGHGQGIWYYLSCNEKPLMIF